MIVVGFGLLTRRVEGNRLIDTFFFNVRESRSKKGLFSGPMDGAFQNYLVRIYQIIYLYCLDII